MEKKTNLFIVSNTLTLITASMIIQDKHKNDDNILMIIVNTLDINFWNTMSFMAQKLNCFKKITIFNAYCTKPYFSTKDIENDAKIFDFLLFEKDVNCNDFNNIYVTLFYYQTKLIIDYYSNAKIIALDNGIGSYEPQMLPQDTMNRFTEFYSFNFFDKIIPYEIYNQNHIKNITIDKEIFKQILTSFSTKPIEKNNNKTALFCAQNISLNKNIMTPEEEFNVYITTIKQLINEGYTVYYKEHPKTPIYFQEKLKTIQNKNLIMISGTTPAEILIPQLMPNIVVGIFSTSLLLIPHLFGIPAYTITLINNFSSNPAFQYAYALVKSYIPDINEIFNKKTNTKNIIESKYLPLTNILHTSLTKEIPSEEDFIKIKEYIKTQEYAIFEYFNIPENLFNIFKSYDYNTLQEYIADKS